MAPTPQEDHLLGAATIQEVKSKSKVYDLLLNQDDRGCLSRESRSTTDEDYESDFSDGGAEVTIMMLSLMNCFEYLKKVVCRLGDPTVESDWGLVEVSGQCHHYTVVIEFRAK